MTEPLFLELADVLALHDQAVDRFGGLTGVRDEGLLLSAMLGRRTDTPTPIQVEAMAALAEGALDEPTFATWLRTLTG